MNHQRTFGNIISITILALLIMWGSSTTAFAGDGDLDLSFHYDGKQRISIDVGGLLSDSARATAIQADGKILLVGSADTADGDTDGAVVRLLPDGNVDMSFGNGGSAVINIGTQQDEFSAVLVQPDQKILLGGTIDYGSGDYDFYVVRLNPNGTLDTGFAFDGRIVIPFDLGTSRWDELNAMALQSDGKVVLVGQVASVDDDFDIGIARLTADGLLDTSFSDDGKKTLLYDAGGYNADMGKAVAIQHDGKIVIAADFEVAPWEFDIGVFRLTPSGGTDSTFGGGGVQIAFDLVGANLGVDAANALAIDSTGRIIVAGQAQVNSSDVDMAFARINPDGSMDTSFSGDGKKTVWFDDGGNDVDIAHDVAVLSDGRIVAVGSAETATDGDDIAVVRLETDGDMDPTFGVGGRVRIPFNLGGSWNDVAYGLAVQNDGKIVVAGSAGAGSAGGADTDFVAARLMSAQGSLIFADGFESGNFNQWAPMNP